MGIHSIFDGLKNLITGFGTSLDKGVQSSYQLTSLSPSDLTQAYRSAWLPQKIINIPAQDTTSKWRGWSADKDDISKLEAEERRLKLRYKVLHAQRMARLFGGSALYIGTDGDPAQPLLPETIKLGGIKYLTVLHRYQLSEGDRIEDISSEYYGESEFFNVSHTRGEIRIHRSRLALFRGVAPLPIDLGGPSSVWSDSVLQAVYDSLIQHENAIANIGGLLFEAKAETISIPGFSKGMQDPRYEELVKSRFGLMSMMKNNFGIRLLDEREVFNHTSQSFNGMPDLMDRFAVLVAGAADIPVTRLFGRSAAGMNSTGDGDLKNYYDSILSHQNQVIEPAMEVLDECLIHSALGSRPEDIHFNWNPLWEPTAKEIAEIGKITAETIKTLSDSKLINEEALAHTAVNSLTETGALPGLEASVDEFGIEPEEPSEEELLAASAMVQAPKVPKTPITDAAPRTLYVSRKVLNAAEILRWAVSQGFNKNSLYPAEELHVTIAYSRAPVDWMKVGTSWTDRLEIEAGGPRLVEKFGEHMVLLFNSGELQWRHREIVDAGASWDYPDYQPHISLSKGEAIPEGVEPYQGRILLGPEFFEEVKED